MAMKICRTCLQVLDSDATCLSLDADDCSFDYPSIRSKLLVCVPELALDVVQCAVICTSCSDALNTAYDFKNKCLQTEERILNYTQYTGCNAESVNISEVIQFNELNTECNSMEAKQFNDIRYPITQIIEQDSEIDIKPIAASDGSADSIATTQSYLFEPDVNVFNIKSEVDIDDSNDIKNKLLTQLSLSPELDVEVRSYKAESMDVYSQNAQLMPSIDNDIKGCQYECMYCQKSFPLLMQLESHILTHAENKPLKCTMCEKRFVRKDKLMLHMRIHTGEKPFECTECGRCFSRKDKLNNHMRTHTGEKPHQCILCQKCFARKDKMNMHMRTQHWLALANLEITVVKNAANINPVESATSENTTASQ